MEDPIANINNLPNNADPFNLNTEHEIEEEMQEEEEQVLLNNTNAAPTMELRRRRGTGLLTTLLEEIPLDRTTTAARTNNGTDTTNINSNNNANGLRTSHTYCIISILIALLAIITSSSTTRTTVPLSKDNTGSSMTTNRYFEEMLTTPRHPKFMWNKVENIHLLGIDLGSRQSTDKTKSKKGGRTFKAKVEKIREWYKNLFKVQYYPSLLDPSIFSWNSGGWTQIVDKITRSTPRLFAMANLILAVTYLVHSAVADAFLGTSLSLSSAASSALQNRNIVREKLGGFLIFKLLLISAVVEPDTLDLLILLSWYTILAFLRSLTQLASSTILHTSHSGIEPRNGVMQLLLLLFVADVSAAVSCTALFHSAGIGMVALLTCDCALLAIEILVNLSRHINHVLDYRHSEVLEELEQSEQREEQNENEVRLEELEESHAKKLSMLDKIIFILELSSCTLTIFHFVHIWSLHGLTLGLVDGVLALHLHTAVSAFLKKISHRRNIHKIARDLDQFFVDASSLEMKKAYAQGDVCCICLHPMVCSTSVKKLPCGHLYHTHCLREVVERARSVQAARCPLCRAKVLDGSHSSPTSPSAMNEQQQPPPLVLPQAAAAGQQREHALFRFSTDNIVPAWLPLPAFSFEIVRRPAPFNAPDPFPTVGWVHTPENTPPATPVNAAVAENNNQTNNNEPNNMPNQSNWRRFLLGIGMLQLSPEEQAAAVTQLVDMFPQYHRVDLLRELRERGTMESVVESILLGTFSGIARGMADDEDNDAAMDRENDGTPMTFG